MEEEYEDILIKCKVRLSKQMFPKDKLIGNGDFGIISVTVLDTLQGEPQVNKWGCITLTGNMCEINDDEIYVVIGKEVENERFGLQYKVVFMCIDIKLTNKEDQYKFLEKILPEKQCIEIFKTFENPIEILENKDIKALCSVKGVGVPTALKLIEKYESSKDYSEAYVKLDKYGLTNNMIEKLVDYFGSPNTVISKVEENPYLLIDEMDGIGWEKADDMALNSGLGEHSINRIKAYIKYYLYEEANIGNTWVDIDDLLDAVDGTIGVDLPQDVLSQALTEMNEKKIIWTNEDKDKVGLMKYYELEKHIAEELHRLNTATNHFRIDEWESRIKRLEKRQGWEFSSEQIEGIQAILENQVIIITGSAGCVDCDTEYFNGVKWKKISDYIKGENVLQYNKDGTANLILPQAYIKEKEEFLNHIKNETGSVDQCVCDNHNIIYLSSKNNLNVKKCSDLIKMHNGNQHGFSGKFITTFKYDGIGVNLTDNQIRLMVAVIADGSLMIDNPNYTCRFHVKKDRKKKRLKELFRLNNLNWREVDSAAEGYSDFYINPPRLEKEFTAKYWYNCSYDQLKIIASEVLNWDGSIKDNRESFSANIKSTADFIQFVFSATGKRAKLSFNDRRGQSYLTNGKQYIRNSIDYNVHISQGATTVSIKAKNKNKLNDIKKYRTTDGYKYCFTVPSHMLVLRRNGSIFITGNCGKSSTVAGMLEVFKENYTFAQTALSGRASCNLSDITGEDGYTIHRLLGYNPKTGYRYNKNNQLPKDEIILDEISMVGADIFYKLIQSIKTGSKLVMLGDRHQLEAIGVGNIMFDMIESRYIKCVELTKIHRQAEKSAIITESIKVRNQEQIIDKNFVGKEIRGELQDFELDIYTDKNKTSKKIIEHFEELLPLTKDIFDIQVIVPMKNRGKASAYYLNNLLQEIVIDVKNNTGLLIGENSKFPFTIYLGDKVLNNKNNYETLNEYGDEVPIFNGDLGVVVGMDTYRNTLVVNFNNKGNIYITKDHLSHISLGYASTCHKMQGSGIKYVIAGLDYSHYKLLTKEMVYTMQTRAKEHCVLCAENKALRYAINHTGVSTKQTHLKELLQAYLPKQT